MYEFTAAIAVQVAKSGEQRVHLAIDRLKQDLAGADRAELWRDSVTYSPAAEVPVLAALERLSREALAVLPAFADPIRNIRASMEAEDDGLRAPNCPVCLRPLEPVEKDGVVTWACDYHTNDD